MVTGAQVVASETDASEPLVIREKTKKKAKRKTGKVCKILFNFIE